MPTYEYKCGKCGTIEVTQKITDRPLKKCPDCGCKVKKLISQSSFHLKGSGWYATDYKKGDTGGNGNGKKKQKEEQAAPKVETAKVEPAKTESAKTGGSKESASAK